MRRNNRLLPRLELEVMKSLWALEEASVAQVRAHMEPERPLAYTTVMTLLDRLARKSVVDRRKRGRGYIYWPVLTRQAAMDLALERLMHDFFDDSPERLRRHLGKTPPPAAEEPTAESLDSALL